MSDPALLAIRHAVENASNEPVTDDTLRAMLRGLGGSVAQRRALFEDTSLRTLVRAGVAAGVRPETILAAYAAARLTVAAANSELDNALRGGW